MVLEVVTDISSGGGELATAIPPKLGDGVPAAAPTNSQDVVVVEEEEARDVPPEVSASSSSMRMYADELTRTEYSNAEALLGFSPTNEHREAEPVCGAYFNTHTPTAAKFTSSDVKRVSSSTIIVPSSIDERQEETEETVVVVADVAEMEEKSSENILAETDVIEETPVDAEAEAEKEEAIIEVQSVTTDVVEEKLTEEEVVIMQDVEEEVTETPAQKDLKEADIVPEQSCEPVLLETAPDSIEASFSTTDEKVVDEPEQKEAEPESPEALTVARTNDSKKKRLFLTMPHLSKSLTASSFAKSRVARSFTNTLLSLSKPSVSKASMRDLTKKMPKMEKLPSVAKLSSSVVAGSSLISKRLPSLPTSQRLPKKLSKPSFRKKSRKAESGTHIQENKDVETATPKEQENEVLEIAASKEASTVQVEPNDGMNSKCPTTDLENTAEVEVPASPEGPDAISEVPVSIVAEEPQHERSYFDDLLDKLDSLCAPLCKDNSHQQQEEDILPTSAPRTLSTSEHTEEEHLVITTSSTNPAENSYLDGIKSICSIVTEHSFFGEDKPVVQASEPEKTDGSIADVMLKESLEADMVNADEVKMEEKKSAKSMFSFRRSNLMKEKTTKSSLKIFAPSVSAVNKGSDMKKAAEQSFRRLTNRKHAGQEAPAVVPLNSQSLDLNNTTTGVYEKAAPTIDEIMEMAPKEVKTSEPAGEIYPDANALLGLSQSVSPKEEETVADAEALLGRSRSNL